MSKIKLLDCTLRDGGYVNDWKFGHDNIESIFERLVDAGVDVIEIGFLDDRRPFDIDRSIMPDTDSVEKIYGNLDRKQAQIVGMIDYGTCDISNIKPCSESYIDGIRVIFKKGIMHEAMEYCRAIKKLGYKVYSQLVSITSYTDEELLELISLVNDVKPYAVSMVDTYGLLHPEDLLHYYEILDANVDSTIGIGFHAHNNFQLAYANALAFLGKETDRDIVVDATLYGMGKSAGNAPLELVSMRLNEKYGKSYNINPMLEAIQESIMGFYDKAPWGYKMFFYLCALNDCHPNYLTLYKDKQNLSVSKLNDILSMIEPEDKKLLYDKIVAEQLYDQFVTEKCSEDEAREKLSAELKNRNILVVGPGKNIELQKARVDEYIAKKNPYVISINYIPKEIKVDAVFTPTDNTIMKAELAIYEKFVNAKIPHYTGADSFALNGAFAGYGVNYKELGVETADMVADILVNGAKPGEMAIKTLNNGIATVNTETAEQIGLDYSGFKDMCEKVVETKTAKEFDEK